MKLFIDTANIADIKDAYEMGVISGVTTNPSIIAKEGKESDALAKYQRECELAKIHNSPYNHVKKWFLERYKDEFTTETAAAN